MEIKYKHNTEDWVEEISLDLEIIKDLNPLENSTWAEVNSPSFRISISARV